MKDVADFIAMGRQLQSVSPDFLIKTVTGKLLLALLERSQQLGVPESFYQEIQETNPQIDREGAAAWWEISIRHALMRGDG